MRGHRGLRLGGAWGVAICMMAGVMLTGCGGASNTSGASPTGSPATSATKTATGGTGGGVGGAHITKPFDRTITGAQCYAGTGANKGKAAFGFPDRDLTTAPLAFTLGPLTDGSSPGQEHNAPYTGAGHYDNIGIVVRPESGSPIIGFGVVTVNSDLRTGSFQMSDGSAAGTWDCGSPVTP